jgi:hypothetical protein
LCRNFFGVPPEERRLMCRETLLDIRPRHIALP